MGDPTPVLAQRPREHQPPPLWLLGILSLYAIVRVAASLYHFLSGQADFQHDIHQQYRLWAAYVDPSRAHEVLSPLMYLPHAWVVLTPLFSLGWPVTKVIWCGVCVGLHAYIAWRICRLAGLQGAWAWLFIACYSSQLGVGLTIALGNLVVLSLAAVLAAYPFGLAETGADGQQRTSAMGELRAHGCLFLSSVKHIVVFPVFLMLLIKRTRLVLVTGSVVVGILLVSLWWANLDVLALRQHLHSGTQTLSVWMHETVSVSLVPLFEKIPGGTIVLWCLWAILFVVVMMVLRDSTFRLAGLLLISLLPIHHRVYDLIVSGLALALFVRHGPLWMTLVTTAALSGLWETAGKRLFVGPLQFLQSWPTFYYQFVILAMLGLLFVVQRQSVRATRVRPEERAPGTAQETAAS